jgi:hypothetical protein
MTRSYATVIVVMALAAGVAAQQDKKNDAAPTVSGVWQMNVQGDHVIPIGMELKQDGENVTGTILMPTQHIGQRKEISLEGKLVDGTLTLSGTAEGASEETAKLEIAAKLEKDGTMTGTLSVGKHRAPWTAERLGR